LAWWDCYSLSTHQNAGTCSIGAEDDYVVHDVSEEFDLLKAEKVLSFSKKNYHILHKFWKKNISLFR
jgi:hypothetical protein